MQYPPPPNPFAWSRPEWLKRSIQLSFFYLCVKNHSLEYVLRSFSSRIGLTLESKVLWSCFELEAKSNGKLWPFHNTCGGLTDFPLSLMLSRHFCIIGITLVSTLEYSTRSSPVFCILLSSIFCSSWRFSNFKKQKNKPGTCNKAKATGGQMPQNWKAIILLLKGAHFLCYIGTQEKPSTIW